MALYMIGAEFKVVTCQKESCVQLGEGAIE